MQFECCECISSFVKWKFHIVEVGTFFWNLIYLYFGRNHDILVSLIWKELSIISLQIAQNSTTFVVQSLPTYISYLLGNDERTIFQIFLFLGHTYLLSQISLESSLDSTFVIVHGIWMEISKWKIRQKFKFGIFKCPGVSLKGYGGIRWSKVPLKPIPVIPRPRRRPLFFYLFIFWRGGGELNILWSHDIYRIFVVQMNLSLFYDWTDFFENYINKNLMFHDFFFQIEKSW